MKIWKTTLATGLLLLTLTAAQADTYIRNKPVPNQGNQATVYVSKKGLSDYFTPEELKRCQFDPDTKEITVDGTPLAEKLGQDPEANVPLIELAEALGFQKRVNKSLGVVDYVAPSTLEGKTAAKDAPKRKGREYQVAGGRMQKILRKHRVLTNHPETERVQRIGLEIADSSDMPGQQWNFLIVDDPSPNAYCTGVGWVAVTDSLLALKLTDDELAGLIAHEVGHGCRRDMEEQDYNEGAMDSLAVQVRQLDAQRQQLIAKRADLLDRARRASALAQQMQTAAMINEMRNEASEASRQAEALNRPIRNLEREIENKAKLYKTHKSFAKDSKFRHQDETDADVKGLYYATRAGYSPDGLMSALQKLSGDRAQKFGRAAYEGGFNHPPVNDRIATLRKVMADWRNR